MTIKQAWKTFEEEVLKEHGFKKAGLELLRYTFMAGALCAAGGDPNAVKKELIKYTSNLGKKKSKKKS